MSKKRQRSKLIQKRRGKAIRKMGLWRGLTWDARLMVVGIGLAMLMAFDAIELERDSRLTEVAAVFALPVNVLHLLIGRAAFVLPTTMILIAMVRKWHGHYLVRRQSSQTTFNYKSIDTFPDYRKSDQFFVSHAISLIITPPESQCHHFHQLYGRNDFVVSIPTI